MSTISRGITATWWYTFSGILVFQATTVFVWTTALLTTETWPVVAVVGLGGIAWCGCASSSP